jgi:hypothetical protein
MRRPTVAGVRARARRHRPAIILSTSAVMVALAGGFTGAALAGGHDEHGWGERGEHARFEPGIDDDVPGHR